MQVQCVICKQEFTASEVCACPYCGNAKTVDIDPPVIEETKEELREQEEEAAAPTGKKKKS